MQDIIVNDFVAYNQSNVNSQVGVQLEASTRRMLYRFWTAFGTGDVTDNGKTVLYQDKTYKVYQDAKATVEFVAGEFYWKVQVGETVRAVDYIAPPECVRALIDAVGSRGRRRQGCQAHTEQSQADEERVS